MNKKDFTKEEIKNLEEWFNEINNREVFPLFYDKKEEEKDEDNLKRQKTLFDIPF